MLDLTILEKSVLADWVLYNICISEDDWCDLPVEPQQPNATKYFDDIFTRVGHKLQGVQMIQHHKQQLLNIQ